MQHRSGTEGMEALITSLAFGGAAIVLVFLTAVLLAPQAPRARAFFDPLNALILVTQVIDGSTTWIGVSNPFEFDIPEYHETVFISGLIIETFGGLVYFGLKILLGVLVVLALAAASEIANGRKERIVTTLVQLSLVIIGAIPVWNNTANFLASA